MLNKSGGNMYHGKLTWNPCRGKCIHECDYCLVDDMRIRPVIDKKYSGKPEIVQKELKENLYKHGEGVTIFVQNMSDLFADDVLHEDIKAVLNYCNKYPKNTYLFQTKNPERFNDFLDEEYPPDTIKATTIETNRDTSEISKAQLTIDRAESMIHIRGRKQITIEPILKFDKEDLIIWMNAINPEIIYIGADSKRHGLEEPTEKEIVDLYKLLKSKFDVRLKPNLRRIAPSLFSS